MEWKMNFCSTTLLCLTILICTGCFVNRVYGMEHKSNKSLVLTYNICSSEPLYGTPLDPKNRFPEIMNKIKEWNPDILCLQEPRIWDVPSLKEELSKLGYDIVEVKPEHTYCIEKFSLITAYKRDTYNCLDNRVWWFKEGNPEEKGGNKWSEHGRISTLTKLCRKDGNSQKPLYIVNTHLGLKEEEKTFSINLALRLFDKYVGQEPIFWCGDFNFFDQWQGHNQRKMITDAGFTDLLTSLTTFSGQKLVGTFVGYSIDSYYSKSVDTMTRLDGMFVRNLGARPGTIPPYPHLAPDLNNRDELLSDHLPIVTEIDY